MQDDVKYLGRRIVRDPLTGKITVTQQDFIQEMESPTLSRERAGQKTEPLTAEEHGLFRSCIGDLQWIAGASRPDASAPTSLLQNGSCGLQRQSFPLRWLMLERRKMHRLLASSFH